MTHRRGDGSQKPDECATLVAPVAKEVTWMVETESEKSVCDVSPNSNSLFARVHDDVHDLDPLVAEGEPGGVEVDAREGEGTSRRIMKGAQPEPKTEGEEYIDEDGAVYFDDGAEERGIRLPPGVPVPSPEMVRRHKAAGHSPYKPWCSICVRAACNAPAHRARSELQKGAVPEVHCDYGFFKDNKGVTEDKVTVLVSKDRISSAVCADVMPKKGIG